MISFNLSDIRTFYRHAPRPPECHHLLFTFKVIMADGIVTQKSVECRGCGIEVVTYCPDFDADHWGGHKEDTE